MSAARRLVCCLLFAGGVAAQQRPVFDVDDFVAPGGGPFFVSRLVTGGAWNLVDDYRPVEQDAFFVHVANSFYWSQFQLDYKRSEVRGSEESGPVDVQSCRCSPPIYFPTPPPRGSMPAAPLPGSKDTLQFAWYRQPPARDDGQPVTLRYRATWSRQPIETNVTSFPEGEQGSKMSGDEQSFGLDADVHFRVRGRDVWGSLAAARTVRSGTTDDRAQTELVYTARFPAVAVRNVLLRADMTIGGVSNRGGTALNVVSPAFEAFWHDAGTEINVHLIWSPVAMNSGGQGWRTEHQVALLVDRAVFVKLFGK